MLRLALFLSLFATAAAAFPVQRCINLGNDMERGRKDNSWSYTIDPAHFQIIAEAGFDTVRFPVNAMDWFQYGRVDSAFLAKTREVVDGLRAAGLNVILDVHGFKPINEDPDAYEDTLIAVWDELSEAFAGYDDGLIFEILNEPKGKLTTERAIDLYKKIIPRVRVLHPDRWIVVGGGDKSDEAELFQFSDPSVLGPNVAYTFHFYDPFDFTHQNDPPDQGDNRDARKTGPHPRPYRDWGTEADRANVAWQFQRAVDAAEQLGIVVFLGEFGVFDAAPEFGAIRWSEDIAGRAEAAGMPWCYWAFGGRFGIFDPEKGWLTERLDALIPQ